MLIANRRLRLIYISLAGMEAAVLTPILILLFRNEILWGTVTPLHSLTPINLFLWLWAGLLFMLTAVDLFAHSKLEDEGYRLGILLVVVLSALISVRLLAIEGRSFFDIGWIWQSIVDLFSLHRGLRPTSAIFLLTLFLWMRGSAMSSREISFIGVGLSFRVGILTLILAGGTLAFTVAGGVEMGIMILALYFCVGLMGVALVRTHDRATTATGSSGAILSNDRLLQLLLVVALAVGLPLLIGVYFTPERIVDVLRLFDPLWRLLGRLGVALLYLFAIVLEWIVGWMLVLLGPLFEDVDLSEALGDIFSRLNFQPPEDQQEQPEVEPWPYAGILLAVLRVVGISAVVALILWMIYALLLRRKERPYDGDREETSVEDLTFGGGALRRGLDRLRNLARLAGRFGLSRDLLAAVSVENLYANLSRIARERGEPREPAQPPDAYLPALQRAFPGSEEALGRITAAYMQVHYGDRPLTIEELTALREEYEAIRSEASPLPESDRQPDEK